MSVIGSKSSIKISDTHIQIIQHFGKVVIGCILFSRWGSTENAHTGNRAPVTSMGGLYDTTTLCVLLLLHSSKYVIRFECPWCEFNASDDSTVGKGYASYS